MSLIVLVAIRALLLLRPKRDCVFKRKKFWVFVFESAERSLLVLRNYICAGKTMKLSVCSILFLLQNLNNKYLYLFLLFTKKKEAVICLCVATC